MKIQELYITEFGCLKDCRISPKEGLNLIEGENESGKSTVLLFIKFMLYGLAKRKAGDDGEHDRSISWQGHLAAGSMTVETATGIYRIERSHMEMGGRKKGVECRVTNCVDGSELALSCEPGEYFLGVPREVFESTAAVGQMRCAKLDGEKTAGTLGNLLLAADESVDVARVLKKMDDVRSIYYLKRGQGGRLTEQATEMAELRQRQERATANALRLSALESSLAEDIRQRDAVRTVLEQATALRDQRHDAAILCRFEKLHEEEKALAEKRRMLTALENTEQKTDFLPTETHIGALRAAADTCREAETAVLRATEEVAREEQMPMASDLLRVGEALAERGGGEAVLAELRKVEKKASGGRIRGILFLIFGILADGIGGVCMKLWSKPIAYGLFGVAALCGLLAILSFLQAIKAGKKQKALMEPYGKRSKELPEYLRQCEEALAEERRRKSRLETAVAGKGFAEAHAARATEALASLLRKTVTEELTSPLDLAELEARRLERFCQRRDALAREIDGCERLIASEQGALSEYEEAVLASRVTVDIHSVTKESLDEAARRCRFEAEKLKMLEEKLANKGRERMALLAADHDPVAISDRLAQKTEENRADRAYCDALDLAISALQQAEETMRGNVTPELTRSAGEWMRTVSDGRYDTVKTTKELRLSMEQDGYPVAAELVSGGTRELAYLSLRLALMSQIYREEMPPLLLDEALCQFDDTRAKRVLSLLNATVKDGLQVLLFTCHGREERLCETLGIPVNRISM